MAWRPFYAIWVLITLLVFALALPLCIWDLTVHKHEKTYVVWFVAGLFVLGAVPISVYGVQAHLEQYVHPRLQKHIVRILWMPCVYGLDAWLALRFKDSSVVFDALRECYEAFVIYHFFVFLIVFLEQNGSVDTLLSQKDQVNHPFPVNLFTKPWRMGPEFLRKCKAGVLNYVIIRPCTALIAVISDSQGVYGDGELFNATKSYTYCVFINGWSQTHAIYCLAMLFQATRMELEPIRPIAKFICVKAVIFLSFYQSIAIVVLVHMHVLSSRTLNIKDYDIKDVSNGLQEFIICVEMFAAACGHLVAFPVSDFPPAGVPGILGGTANGTSAGSGSRANDGAAHEGGAPAGPQSKLSSVLDVLDMSDVYVDVRDRAESVGGRVVERVKAATVGALGVTFSSSALAPGSNAAKPSKVKLDAVAPDDGTARLLPPHAPSSSDAVPGVVDLSHQCTRDNLPFLNASAGQHQRRTGALSPRGNSDEALARSKSGGQSTSAGSTVSIGGVQIPLADLLEGPVRSPMARR